MHRGSWARLHFLCNKLFGSGGGLGPFSLRNAEFGNANRRESPVLAFGGGPLFARVAVHSGPSNPFHPRLLEPAYWQARLAQLQGRAHKMLIVPRHDLEVPGLRVMDLLLRGHDGMRLRGLISWWPITGAPNRVLLHWPNGQEAPGSHLGESQPENVGIAHLYLYGDPDRRLEDRVLDFVCLICGTRSMPEARQARPRLEIAPGEAEPDEYRIGRALLEKGWCSDLEVG